MNQFIFIGKIFKDIELRYSKDNKAIANITIIVNNGKDDNTFIKATCFGLIAESCNKYCHKDDKIAVKGIIKNNNWEDKQGIKHYDYQFLIEKLTFLGNKENFENKIKLEKKEDNNKIYEDFGNSVKSEDIVLTDEDLPF